MSSMAPSIQSIVRKRFPLGDVKFRGVHRELPGRSCRSTQNTGRDGTSGPPDRTQKRYCDLRDVQGSETRRS